MIDNDLRKAAADHGTPLYVYELDAVRSRAAELRGALPPGAQLLYSVKANPLPAVGAQLREAGCRAEVSSPGELQAALDAGFAAAEMLYTGPGKTPAEIGHALALGVGTFSCESAVDLRRLGDAAATAGREAAVLLRLQPGEGVASGLSMVDGRQFGFLPADAVAACRNLPPGVSLHGFHAYLGSQIAGVEALLDGFARARQVVEGVCAEAGVTPAVADLGGGFAWPYAAPGTGEPLRALAEPLAALIDGWGTGPAPVPWFESGRRLTAESGWLLTSVMDVKARPGRTVVVVDAGINVLGGMAGLGRVLRPATGFRNLSASEDRPEVTVDVMGPLCTPLDRLAVHTPVREPRVGDLLCVPNVGAYGLTASLTSFLSRPAPVEVVLDGGRQVGSWRLTNRHVPIPG